MLKTAVLRVAIVEDQAAVRDGLQVLIDATSGYRCTAKFSSMEAALDGIADQLPDVMLVDIGLPEMSGIEGIGVLKGRYPALPLIVLTVHKDDTRIFDAICAGASGYLLKNTAPERLMASLREAVEGGAPMSPEIARRVLVLFRDARPPQQSDHDLTPHELRLLKLLVEGHNYKTSAAELKVSINTIRFHMRNIYEKLQVHSKSEAVAKILRKGIIR